MIVFAPLGVAVSVGPEAGAKDFSYARFTFEVLAEGTFFPWCRWFGEEGF